MVKPTNVGICCVVFYIFACQRKHGMHFIVTRRAGHLKRIGFWQVAWPRYTLAAIATGQLTMAQCQHHAAVMLDVASLAGAQGRTAWLAVHYDEIARLCLSCKFHVVVFVVAVMGFPGRTGPTYRASLVAASVSMAESIS